jgi:hypothetical protein
MAYNTKAIKTDVNAKPIPQLYNPVTDEYEVLQGTGGAARQVLYGPDGQPISVADNKLAVRAAELEAKIEAVRVLLNTLAGEDFATQTTLAQILGKMIAAPATEAKQDSLAALVGAIEDKLDEGQLAVRAAELETAISNLQTALLGSQSTAAKQDALAGLVGALDSAAVSDPAAAGAVIALLKGVLERFQAVEGKIDGITDGTAPAKTETQVTGSTMEIYKATVAERPAANSVPVGACFMAVNTGEIWQSNGTDWVVM